MYVTTPNESFALDAGRGRGIWHYRRPRTQTRPRQREPRCGCRGRSRVRSDRNAHVLALNRFTGALLWDTEMEDWRKNYYATIAPLPAGDLVVSGVGGGEHGANGFVVAHDQATGREVSRFSTVPKRGEPRSRPGRGRTSITATAQSVLHRAATIRRSTSSTGPSAIRARSPTATIARTTRPVRRHPRARWKTGRLRWSYNPRRTIFWDWDATQTSVLVDDTWQDHAPKLMLTPTATVSFYVFNRTDGELLLAKPFVKHLTWAGGVGADGRPVRIPNQEPTPHGRRSAPRRTARRTRSRHPSIPPPVSTTCRRSRSAASARKRKRQ